MDEFNMYADFINDNKFSNLPFMRIEQSSEDDYVQWTLGDRLDKLAYKYYNNAAFGKFILLANPQYISEGDIEVESILRIPMPKQALINSIRSQIEKSKAF
jgi:hypothetical protein